MFMLQEGVWGVDGARYNANTKRVVVWVHKRTAGDPGKKQKVGFDEVTMTAESAPSPHPSNLASQEVARGFHSTFPFLDK
jgi:hypothetical protein